ncbi:crossover junction endodeoxyribonuclease RuvC [Sulfurihydrogenibium azorense]|uniref:Crossover junction endodeoxyribonuclease RuvC (Hollidayjunction nuclease ruvC) (Holliday junction resolvase ruvC) n=1 Tax=Sulfurihydrogenibium azorense (strain DSM 15241 / OCM 825 / Az-Fu1) TaxID=204536 RepID=C1DV86_SULAA|nr:crossover junction endodeoxyribonuclease RuvC [Sulfurihydrogenibium azorense]ACN98432.1 crossover junction endodeoxyribonuclease RuvC (Hollidayjunction nuclease ruvC) (Holliday junction resolvase ruvC) [Sulfurihydrogenibium azorense Az-Fu1]MDM7273832.1 crossover junction endodeoxyribonuclease RuvC [Sulfurihydrogenibium azorense]
MKIISLDPSTSKTGYAVAEVYEDKISLIEYGSILLKGKKNTLKLLFETLQDKINQHSIEAVILETPFYSINAQTLIKLGEVRGVILLLAQINNLKVFQYTPAEVKIAATGYGRSSKEEVINMVNRIFNLDIQDSDIADSLAILYCHTLQKVEV